MLSDLPASLRPIGPYVSQAKDLEDRQPLVAHFCKIFALSKGIPLIGSDKDAEQYMNTLMTGVEKEEDTIAGVKGSDAENQQAVIDSAMAFFNRADDQERQNIGNRTVQRQFLAAYVLFDVATHFGPLDSHTAMKQNYAKVKAAAIGKALKEGVPYRREEDIGHGGSAVGNGATQGSGGGTTAPSSMDNLMGGPSDASMSPGGAGDRGLGGGMGQQQQQYREGLQSPQQQQGGFQQGYNNGPQGGYGNPNAPFPQQQQQQHNQQQQQQQFDPYSQPPSAHSPQPPQQQQQFAPQSAPAGGAGPAAQAQYIPSMNPPAPPPAPALASYGPSQSRVDSSVRLTAPNGHKPSSQAVCEAAKQAKFAVNALNFADVPYAVQSLKKSLAFLEGTQVGGVGVLRVYGGDSDAGSR